MHPGTPLTMAPAAFRLIHYFCAYFLVNIKNRIKYMLYDCIVLSCN
uniref:Uncharacterized protein n=1 Tax=Anguilla anguilla TaxID=7936 RepID=A0A0E9SCD7_ANGAN